MRIYLIIILTCVATKINNVFFSFVKPANNLPDDSQKGNKATDDSTKNNVQFEHDIKDEIGNFYLQNKYLIHQIIIRLEHLTNPENYQINPEEHQKQIDKLIILNTKNKPLETLPNVLKYIKEAKKMLHQHSKPNEPGNTQETN